MIYSTPSDFEPLQTYIDEVGSDTFTDRSRFLLLQQDIKKLARERDSHLRVVERMLNTGRVRTLMGDDLVNATPDNAHAVIDISSDEPAVIGLFRDRDAADAWAVENLTHSAWNVVPLRPAR